MFSAKAEGAARWMAVSPGEVIWMESQKQAHQNQVTPRGTDCDSSPSG